MTWDENFYPIPQLNTNVHNSNPFQIDNTLLQINTMRISDKYSKKNLVTLKAVI